MADVAGLVEAAQRLLNWSDPRATALMVHNPPSSPSAPLCWEVALFTGRDSSALHGI